MDVRSVLATYVYMYMDSRTACFGCVGFKRFDSGLLTYIANSTTKGVRGYDSYSKATLLHLFYLHL